MNALPWLVAVSTYGNIYERGDGFMLCKPYALVAFGETVEDSRVVTRVHELWLAGRSILGEAEVQDD